MSHYNVGINNPMFGKHKDNSGEKNPMYGKTHSDKTRKKMSDAVIKAYAEGRIPKISEHCIKLGQIASAKVRAEQPELVCSKVINYITWLFNNTYTSEPSFADTSTGLQDALDMERTEPQGKYWVALLQIDFDKVQQNLADNKLRKALCSILYYINPLVPPEAGKCLDYNYVDNNWTSELVNNLVRDYCMWMIDNRNMLENYMIQCYALSGQHRAQYMELLKRRNRRDWGDQKSEKSVTLENKKDSDSSGITITFTEA